MCQGRGIGGQTATIDKTLPACAIELTDGFFAIFEIYQSPKNKRFYFRLKAKNRQVILASEGYKSNAPCKNGIKSVQKNAASEDSFEKKIVRRAGATKGSRASCLAPRVATLST